MGKEETTTTFKEYATVTKTARARKLLKPEVVRCYNGDRIGQAGDYVVFDDEDRVMIMKSWKFENNFREKKR